jgi:hypothetical protein
VADCETKIKIIGDADATGDVASAYDEWCRRSARQKLPGTLKCFSHRPDFLLEVPISTDARIDWTRTHIPCGYREPTRKRFRR